MALPHSVTKWHFEADVNNISDVSVKAGLFSSVFIEWPGFIINHKELDFNFTFPTVLRVNLMTAIKVKNLTSKPFFVYPFLCRHGNVYDINVCLKNCEHDRTRSLKTDLSNSRSKKE